MAAPAYATDLTDVYLSGGTTSWTAVAISGSGPNAVTAETDYFIQGTACISRAAWSSGQKGMIYDSGAGITLPTDGAVLVWATYLAPNSIATKASGGLRVWGGSSASAFYLFNVDGSDTNEFGGWTFGAFNPSWGGSPDATQGSPSSTLQFLGAGALLPGAGPSKGNPMACDAIRWGRGELRSSVGDSGTPATFAGAQAYGDAVTRRWGLLSLLFGAYRMSGLFVMGLAGTSVYFKDSNRVIFIRDHDRVPPNFNGFEVRHASSFVEWTNVSVSALGTYSKGRFVTTDNATINKVSCTFTDMDTFAYQSNTTLTGCTYRRCGQVSLSGATLSGGRIEASSAANAVLAATPAGAALVSDTTFVSAGTGHALQVTGTAANFTLTDVTFTGYAGTSGSTGNEAVYVNIATGSLNLTVSGGTTPSVRTAGCVVTVISGAVNVTVKALTEAGAAVASAAVHLEATAGGPFPADVTVTIANSGTTATVTHTAHGLATNDKVVIRGASHLQNIGVFTITVTGSNTYTYAMGSAPGSSPTGTITSSFVVLNGTTNGSGEITMSRVFGSAQPVGGRIRKSSSAPFYKSAPLVGSVSSSTGLSLIGLMISDD